MIIYCQCALFFSVMVAKPHLHVSDDLEDVVDDEEDEEWRRWGRFKAYPPKEDPDTLVDFSEMGANELVPRSQGRGSICFAKLRGDFATKEVAQAVGQRWSNMMMSGGLYHKSYVVDKHTVAFTPEDSDMVHEMKRFLLLQPEHLNIMVPQTASYFSNVIIILIIITNILLALPAHSTLKLATALVDQRHDVQQLSDVSVLHSSSPFQLSSDALSGNWQVEVPPPPPILPIPTAGQLAWQRRELSMFIHFGLQTYGTGDHGRDPPYLFNPSNLNTTQWVEAARAGGFKTVVLTAKHADGFCLWPSKYTRYSVKSSPWRDGQGDVVAELVDSGKKLGVRVGLYVCPHDNHEFAYGDLARYNEHFMALHREVMTKYGPIAEDWYDGDGGQYPYSFGKFWAVDRQLQPMTQIFSDAGPDIRWVGNERGEAGTTCWSMIDRHRLHAGTAGATDAIAKYLNEGDRDGPHWCPAECDVSIRENWFWTKGDRPKNLNELVDIYFASVGRNCVLQLNVPPTPAGLFDLEDVSGLHQLRAVLDFIFSEDFARGKPANASSVWGATRAVTSVAGAEGAAGAASAAVAASASSLDFSARAQISFAGKTKASTVTGLGGIKSKPIISRVAAAVGGEPSFAEDISSKPRKMTPPGSNLLLSKATASSDGNASATTSRLAIGNRLRKLLLAATTGSKHALADRKYSVSRSLRELPVSIRRRLPKSPTSSLSSSLPAKKVRKSSRHQSRLKLLHGSDEEVVERLVADIMMDNPSPSSTSNSCISSSNCLNSGGDRGNTDADVDSDDADNGGGGGSDGEDDTSNSSVQNVALNLPRRSFKSRSSSPLSFAQTSSSAAGSHGVWSSRATTESGNPASRTGITAGGVAHNVPITIVQRWHSLSPYGADKAVDNDLETYWAADEGETTGTLEVDLCSPTVFNVVRIQEPIQMGQRVGAYLVQAWVVDATPRNQTEPDGRITKDVGGGGGQWTIVSSGTTIGHKKLDRLTSVVNATRSMLSFAHEGSKDADGNHRIVS
ncbi:hypothetical protein CBR_g38724 [Chara braunii]|uniref:alpha-L-fucosidase n=1 Tax=Chara braunii TaxID=69332 RepID=A0A388LQA2_CHABU|nr:hypothetical protein CBR_g38724 [Chara braunii]|eukprot:GBG84439.1 hypothetical protein CBR_g38724 [Chara braunii]